MFRPAYWSSWADCLGMVQQRHPTVSACIVQALNFLEFFFFSAVAAAEQQPEGWRCVPDTILPGYQWAPQWDLARTPTVHWGPISGKAVGGPITVQHSSERAETLQTFWVFSFLVGFQFFWGCLWFSELFVVFGVLGGFQLFQGFQGFFKVFFVCFSVWCFRMFSGVLGQNRKKWKKNKKKMKSKTKKEENGEEEEEKEKGENEKIQQDWPKLAWPEWDWPK